MRRSTSGRSDRFMLISSERVFYAGLHGKPSVRTLGALAICVPLHGTACLEVAGQPPRVGEILAVPAYLPHKITSESREILGLLIEPESVCDEDLA
ncbi:MAG: AraC family transcriptional regulator, partial [Afipia sp.]